MRILYVSTLCSDAKFKLIFDNSAVKPQQQAQKFHGLLSKGLSHYHKSIDFISRPPVNKSTDKIAELMGVQEDFDNNTYHYLKISDNPLFRHLSLFFSGLLSTLKWNFKSKHEDKIIICDILNVSISISALIAAKLCGAKSVAVVTDLPDYMNYTKKENSILGSMNSRVYRKICNYFLKKYDFYVILTEQMNEIVNPKKNPYIVIEGMVDPLMNNMENKLENKYKEKIVLYTGALYEKYGIKSLIEAFMKTEDDDARLWLFGDGELIGEIKKYEKIDSRIKYFGVVPNNDVVLEQLKATILVNPRPSLEEFTKYSFPSKNMEYMASGTPVLTTPLQGMPREYNDYVYIFGDESVEGMSKTISTILSKDRRVLHEKGQLAKQFVLKEKNNFIQAKKITDLIRFQKVNLR